MDSRSTDGTVTKAFGDDPVGRISYDDESRMAVQIMQANRPRLVSDDPFAAEPLEVVTAWLGFISYAGRYEIDASEGVVTHHIEMCSFPNWIGSQQKRFFRFKDGLLELSTPPQLLRGEPTVSILLWERI